MSGRTFACLACLERQIASSPHQNQGSGWERAVETNEQAHEQRPTKPDHMSLITKTQKVEGKNQLPQVVLTSCSL